MRNKTNRKKYNDDTKNGHAVANDHSVVNCVHELYTRCVRTLSMDLFFLSLACFESATAAKTRSDQNFTRANMAEICFKYLCFFFQCIWELFWQYHMRQQWQRRRSVVLDKPHMFNLFGWTMTLFFRAATAKSAASFTESHCRAAARNRWMNSCEIS